jgi:hypothetical protein
MLKAAQTDNFWQSYPFRCALTGLTLKVEGKIKAESETQRVKALGLNNPYTGGLIPP